METYYQKQAADFLARHGLTMRITAYPDDMQTAPAWADDQKPIKTAIGPLSCGFRYRVTISRNGKPGRIAFDFWGSIADREARRERNAKPTAYDVLACISGDVFFPETFKDFCSEYGYETDSRKAEKIFRRCRKFAKQLRAFLSEDEQQELSEIQ